MRNFMTEQPPDLEAMAAALRASGQYRVLRRLAPRPPIAIPDGILVRTGLFVDVETTGWTGAATRSSSWR
jgi:DNA polymerase-3 subunit epsilon